MIQQGTGNRVESILVYGFLKKICASFTCNLLYELASVSMGREKVITELYWDMEKKNCFLSMYIHESATVNKYIQLISYVQCICAETTKASSLLPWRSKLQIRCLIAYCLSKLA
jgi:hypothetical protein